MLRGKENTRSKDSLGLSKHEKIRVVQRDTSVQKSEASTESRPGKILITANKSGLGTNSGKIKQKIDHKKVSLNKREDNSAGKREAIKAPIQKSKDPPTVQKQSNTIQTKGRTLKDVRQKVAKQAVTKKRQQIAIKQRCLGPKSFSKSSKKSLASSIQKKGIENQMGVYTQGKLVDSFIKEKQFSPVTRASENDSIWKYICHETVNINQISIGQFVPIEQIAYGSYFRQNLAVHLPTNCVYTLRMMDKARIIEDELVEQLTQAIKIQLFLSRNSRPCSGFQKLYAVFCDAINIYLILQPVPHNRQNFLLSDRISQSGGLNQQEIAYILKTVIASLRDIHSQSVVLRGIAANSIRNCLGIWKIVSMEKAASVKKKRRHSFMGEISQISHQLAHGLTYGLGYDMWSIGLLLYFLATGKHPFQVDSLAKIQSLDYAFPMLLSSPFLDLLSRLLTEQKYRLSCQQSLRMPFISHEFGGRELVSRQIWSFWMTV